MNRNLVRRYGFYKKMLGATWWRQAVITGDLLGQDGWKSRLLQCYQKLYDTGHQLHSTDQASSLVRSLPLRAGLLHIQLSLHWENQCNKYIITYFIPGFVILF